MSTTPATPPATYTVAAALLTLAEAAAVMGLTAAEFKGRRWPRTFTRYVRADRRRLFCRHEVNEAAMHQDTATARSAVQRLQRALKVGRLVEQNG